MSTLVSNALDEMRSQSKIPNPWAGSRYEWFKQLSGAEAGKFGERLAKAILGGEFVARSTGYDLRLESGRRVEVKLCRKSFSESNVWSWKQIRRGDVYDDLCLIAVEPERARLFLISKKPQPTEEQAHVVSHPTASM